LDTSFAVQPAVKDCALAFSVFLACPSPPIAQSATRFLFTLETTGLGEKRLAVSSLNLGFFCFFYAPCTFESTCWTCTITL